MNCNILKKIKCVPNIFFYYNAILKAHKKTIIICSNKQEGHRLTKINTNIQNESDKELQGKYNNNSTNGRVSKVDYYHFKNENKFKSLNIMLNLCRVNDI